MDGSLPEQQMGSATLLSKSTCVHQRVGGGEGDICMYECMHVCVCVWCVDDRVFMCVWRVCMGVFG